MWHQRDTARFLGSYGEIRLALHDSEGISDPARDPNIVHVDCGRPQGQGRNKPIRTATRGNSD